MRLYNYALLLCVSTFMACTAPKTSNEINATKESVKQIPHFTFQKEDLFPGDGSLLRAEDGVALEDGRIIVVDQAKGLRLIEKDGQSSLW